MEYPRIPSFPIAEDNGLFTGFSEHDKMWHFLSKSEPPEIPDDFYYVGVLDYLHQKFIFWTKKYVTMQMTGYPRWEIPDGQLIHIKNAPMKHFLGDSTSLKIYVVGDDQLESFIETLRD